MTQILKKAYPKLLIALLVIAWAVTPTPSHAKKKKSESESKNNSIENLFRPARISNIYMSPDGKWAAGLAPIDKADGHTGLVIIDLDTMKIKQSSKWKGGLDIYNHQWLNNNFVSFKLSKWDKYVSGVYRLDVKKGTTEPLFANDAVVTLIDPNTEHETLAWVWVRDVRDGKPSLCRVLKTGSARQNTFADRQPYPTVQNPLIRERIPEPHGDVYWWYIDHAHEPRIVWRFFKDKLEYLHRNSREDEWKPLPLDPEEWSIALFTPDNRSVYVAGYKGEDTKGLFLYNIDDDSFSDVLFRDPYYDFSDTAEYMTINDVLVGIWYEKDVPSMVWLVPELESIQAMIDKALPGRVNVVYDWAYDFSRLLIYSYSDITPPEYVMLDLKTKELKEISKSAPWLDNNKLTKTEVFHFTTSDGLRIEGYLNRPVTGQAPYPTVCLVHGGPWARDSGSYDSEVQYLNSQGYAVIKVNYRGSTGYGKKISEDPEFEFRKMNDDITEAVQTAVKSGIADPERLAIMGASFGGYAAMCGAVFEPDLYQCAITQMGVFDWEELIKDRKRQRSRYSYKKHVEGLGDPKEGSAQFEEISPIYHVENIEIPIFVIHGKEDSNVSIKQSKMLRGELKKHGIEHEIYFAPDEGHNVFEWKRRIQTYERIVAFLDQHMK